MKKYSPIKLALAGLLAVILITLTGCGSGSGVSSSGSSGLSRSASISGNVADGFSAIDINNSSQIATILELVTQKAHAAGASGITVQLLLNGGVVDSTTTNSSGDFTFAGVSPGSYTIRLLQGSEIVGSTAPISVTENSSTRLDLSVTGSVLNVEVQTGNGQISGEVEDGVSEDDDSEDDDSEDDDSEDDDSEDDDSEDDDSEDDDSEDDDSEESNQ